MALSASSGLFAAPESSISSESVLDRVSSHPDSSVSAFQRQVDGMVGGFVEQATEWKSLAAMMVGGLAFRVGRVGFLGAASKLPLALQNSVFIQAGGALTGLATEVTVFEATNRSFLSLSSEGASRNLWQWSGKGGFKEGWLYSFVNFGILKSFGKLAEAQNVMLQHSFQDLAMVTGHQVLFGMGLGEKQEGSFAEQLLHAEVTNLQLGAGTALAHEVAGGRLLAWERGLDLNIRSQESELPARSKNRKTLFSHPLLFPMWAMMGADGFGGSGFGEREKAAPAVIPSNIRNSYAEKILEELEAIAGKENGCPSLFPLVQSALEKISRMSVEEGKPAVVRKGRVVSLLSVVLSYQKGLGLSEVEGLLREFEGSVETEGQYRAFQKRFYQILEQRKKQSLPPLSPKPPKARVMPRIETEESRPVDWNPFNSENQDMAIHPDYGEGRVLGKRENGKWVVRFPAISGAVLLEEGSFARPSDPERYEKILAQRVADFSEKVSSYAFLALMHWLPHKTLANYGEFDLRDRNELRESLTGWTLEKIFQLLVARHAVSQGERIGSLSGFQKPLPSSSEALLSHNTQESIWRLYQELGIDPIAFALRLTLGEEPGHVIFPDRKKGTQEKRSLGRILTPDLVRELLKRRPWQNDWRLRTDGVHSSVQFAGFYYPRLYSGAERPHDLTELYFKYREGDPEALSEAAQRMRPLVRKWAANKNSQDCLLIPVQGTAPNEALARQLWHSVFNPWLPRPEGYGKGVEGKRAMVKMKMIRAALRLDPDAKAQIQGKSVLLIDDNLTDGITYMEARRLLLNKGAAGVGLLSLTHTVREPQEMDWLEGSMSAEK
ncbi:MAG: hypothetical protein U1F57_07470 [bacterium]